MEALMDAFLTSPACSHSQGGGVDIREGANVTINLCDIHDNSAGNAVCFSRST